MNMRKEQLDGGNGDLRKRIWKAANALSRTWYCHIGA